MESILSLVDIAIIKSCLLIGGELKQGGKGFKEAAANNCSHSWKGDRSYSMWQLDVENTTRLVLDETDKMLEMGLEQLNEIQNLAQKQTNIIVFSDHIKMLKL